MPYRKKAIPKRSRKTTQKKARSAKVNSARGIRKIAKQVVMRNRETKYTPFVQVQGTQNVITGSANGVITVQPLSNLAAIYPSLGDELGQREGLKYHMLYMQHVVRVQCTPTQRQQPLHVMVVRAKRRAALTLGTNISVPTLFPETRIGAGATCVSTLVGRFEPSAGTIVARKKIYPPKYLQSSTNRFPSSSSNDLVANNYHYECVFNVPIKKVINCETYLAEIPTELSLYYCLLYDPDQYNGTSSQWTMEQAVTRCVFKDI